MFILKVTSGVKVYRMAPQISTNRQRVPLLLVTFRLMLLMMLPLLHSVLLGECQPKPTLKNYLIRPTVQRNGLQLMVATDTYSLLCVTEIHCSYLSPAKVMVRRFSMILKLETTGRRPLTMVIMLLTCTSRLPASICLVTAPIAVATLVMPFVLFSNLYNNKNT